jgi:hypothetical protein
MIEVKKLLLLFFHANFLEYHGKWVFEVLGHLLLKSFLQKLISNVVLHPLLSIPLFSKLFQKFLFLGSTRVHPVFLLFLELCTEVFYLRLYRFFSDISRLINGDLDFPLCNRVVADTFSHFASLSSISRRLLVLAGIWNLLEFIILGDHILKAIRFKRV